MIFKQYGFSLIEVLISFSLMAIGVMGLLKLQIVIDKQADMAINSLGALYTGESKLEYFKGYSYGRINYEDITTQMVPESDMHYQLTWLVSESEPIVISGITINTLKEITLIVRWKDRWNQTHQIELSTMISWYQGLVKSDKQKRVLVKEIKKVNNG